MRDVSFHSPDHRYGLTLKKPEVSRLLALCKKALPHETGGILVGRYTESLDHAFVTSVSGPPPDSRSGRTWFERGVHGLQQWLARLWSRNDYYLGEWHFHPLAAAQPSGTDINQLRVIAQSNSYHCPEPTLLIVGGNPAADWHMRAFVFPKGSDSIELTSAQ